MTKGTLDIVVGGQFGSEGKGAIGGWLAKNRPLAAAIRVAGPNAGHSALDTQGRKWALRQIPVAAVANLDCDVIIGAGSEIDESVLADEVRRLEEAGIPILDRLYVDRSATLLTSEHIKQETTENINGRLGSTAKGIGAARSDRIWRQAATWGDHVDEGLYGVPIAGVDTVARIRNILDWGGRVMLEGTQGFGLGLHTDYYPQCTSSDCRAVDFAAMAGVTPWTDADVTNIWVVLRTHPIRVAGNSGPLKNETTWDALSARSGGYIGPEKTTVTQKVRRVGDWDPQLAEAAVLANGGSQARVALTFFDYWFPALAGATERSALTPMHWDEIHRVEHEVGAKVTLVGTGPDSGILLQEV